MPRAAKESKKIPWLVQRGGVYYVCWYAADKHGRTRTERSSLGTKVAVEAQAHYAAFLAEGHALQGKGEACGMTVAVALDDYWREHVGPNVVDKPRQEDAIRHLKEFFHGCRLSQVDIPLSRQYADARRAGEIGGGSRRANKVGSDSTIRRELVVLQAAANHARKWRRIGHGDMPSIELTREAPRTEVWLTKEELNRAISEADGYLRDFMMIAYYTAARRASIETLTVGQVDLRMGRINLTNPSETANQRRSKKRRPVVPLDARVRPVVERLMIAAGDAKAAYLFGANRDMYRPFREHMQRLGMADKANPHILRHSRATHLLQDGVNIYDVARLLGDTVATVERVYGHHSTDYLATAIQR